MGSALSSTATPAKDTIAGGPSCVLLAIGLDPVEEGARLDLKTDGNPTSLGTRVEPQGSIALDLAGCVPGPLLTGRRFPSGLVSALELVHRSSHSGPVTALVIKTRRPFEYSVSSRQDSVQILLRPDARPTAQAPEPAVRQRVRVMEPLPLQPTAEVETPKPGRRLRRSAPATGETDARRAPAPAGVSGLLEGARLSVSRAPRYDPVYRVIPYPGGDPGWDRGSSVDLVVRAYRHLGIDLQQLIHEDVEAAAADYGIQQPDSNIDHRRIRNLAIFLSRHARSLPVDHGTNWQAGDVVVWARDHRLPNHVGIVSDRRSTTGRPLVIHHPEAQTPREEDALFAWPIRAHYRWLPQAAN